MIKFANFHKERREAQTRREKLLIMKTTITTLIPLPFLPHPTMLLNLTLCNKYNMNNTNYQIKYIPNYRNKFKWYKRSIVQDMKAR